MTFTNTGPAWLCHGNCAPGWTVYRTATVRDGSSSSTTFVALPSSLIFAFNVTLSGKTERDVSGSLEIGGGGSCAADGRTKIPAMTAMTTAVPAAAPTKCFTSTLLSLSVDA